MDKLTTTVLNQRHPRKPILGWRAIDRNGLCIDENNSIAILRAKYGYSVTYRAVR